MTTDYYKVLGVEKGATLAEIRSAWKRKSLQHHPDKNGGDDTMCTRLNQAYGVLSDDQKRRVYDQYGEAGLHGGGGESDPFSFFQQGAGGPGFSFFQQRPKPGMSIQIDVTLEEVCKGQGKSLQVTRIEGDALRPCTACRGAGVQMIMQKHGASIMRSQRSCPDCGGSGHDAKGRRKVSTTETVPLFVGCPEGICFVVGERSNIAVTVRYKPHATFRVRKNTLDLEYTLRLSLAEVLFGFDVTLHHPDGRIIQVAARERVTKPGVYVLAKYGLSLPRMSQTGNLLVTVLVQFPETITTTQLAAMRAPSTSHQGTTDLGRWHEVAPDPSYTTVAFVNSHNQAQATGTMDTDDQPQQCRQQ